MAELLGEELLDEALTDVLGPVDAELAGAIVGICNDAAGDIVGAAVVEALAADRRRVPFVAPWASDLARGLLVLAHRGPGELPSSELLALLSRGRLSASEVSRFAGVVDTAAVLTLDRVVEQVLGPGACAKGQEENEVVVPWLAALRYGHRVHIAQELLRLMPAG